MADVICPGCGGRYHETTERFDPKKQPNGTMFRMKDKYGPKGWNWSGFAESETSIGGLLVCPQCDVSYVGANGRVRIDESQVVEPAGDGEPVEPENTAETQLDDEQGSEPPCETDDDGDEAGQEPEPEDQGLFDAPVDQTEDVAPDNSGFICPVCEKECASERGLNQHMTRSHGELSDAEQKPEVTNG